MATCVLPQLCRKSLVYQRDRRRINLHLSPDANSPANRSPEWTTTDYTVRSGFSHDGYILNLYQPSRSDWKCSILNSDMEYVGVPPRTPNSLNSTQHLATQQHCKRSLTGRASHRHRHSRTSADSYRIQQVSLHGVNSGHGHEPEKCVAGGLLLLLRGSNANIHYKRALTRTQNTLDFLRVAYTPFKSTRTEY